MRVRDAAAVSGLFVVAAVFSAASRALRLTAAADGPTPPQGQPQLQQQAPPQGHPRPAPQSQPQQQKAPQPSPQSPPPPAVYSPAGQPPAVQPQPAVQPPAAPAAQLPGGQPPQQAPPGARSPTTTAGSRQRAARPPSRLASFPPTATLPPSALELLQGCCIGPGCDPREHFDSWCYDKDWACPELKAGWACGAAKCAPRWRAALGDTSGTLPFREVARCASALLQLTGTSWKLPPLPAPGEGPEYSAADFPLSVVATRHMCWRPCNHVWLCHGKVTGSGYVNEYCWRHFYKMGKHHPIRRWKSLMAVWTPPVVDQISSILTQLGNYDTKLHALIRAPLGRVPAGTAVDVGANLGVVTMYAAHQGHRVVAFDATPWTRHKLQLSVWLNNFSSRVRVVPAAVGAAVGTASLAVVPGNLGGNQLVRDGKEELVASNGSDSGRPGQKGTVEVRVTTLDEALRDEKDVFFIKIDIEGHEIQALQGAAQVLRHHKPTLVIETCFWCRPRVLFELMQQHDYVCGREDTMVDRTGQAKRGLWKWDVEQVLRPEYRHQLRPNVLCLWDPAESRKPFDPNPGAPYDKQWTAYRVET
eukprot:TRINITY_DN5756_c0_g1_i1.p1 TRINITY_DN5756_c0_g1~~TRINITY_DN5756_c0_g1_i1.p1  ORF type:complete len:615 (+),score=146.28 TRINITY_DN5756_c0_g1_i1:85-1845(+)